MAEPGAGGDGDRELVGGEGTVAKVRDGLGRNDLQDIGEEMLAAKKKAPREPIQPSALKKAIDAVIS